MIGQDAGLEQVQRWCAVAVRAASAKQADNPVVLAVGPALAITDAFIITSGANARQVRTIVEEVEKDVKAAGGPTPRRVEGLDDARWVLMDFGDFVVHVFLGEAREFYDLEHLWADVDRWVLEPPRLVDASGRA
ncbi:MAG: ribosome silencing factor [Acidimicrobiales bacterium]